MRCESNNADLLNNAVILLLMFVCAVGMLTYYFSGSIPAFYGNQDFLAYHSAWHAFFDGSNPYLNDNIADLQLSDGGLTNRTNSYLYAPEFLVFMSPILCWGYSLSRILWLALNVFLAIFAVNLARENCAGSKSSRLETHRLSTSALIVLFFFPLWDALGEGQLGIVFGFALSILVASIRANRLSLLAISIPIFLIKPHLFLPLLVALVFWLCKNKNIKALIWPICVIIPASILLEIMRPGIHLDWINSPNVTRSFELTATLPSLFVRFVKGNISGNEYQIVGCFICAAIIFSIYLVRKTSNFIELIPTLITISILVSPRAWVSDANVLLPVVGMCFGAYAGPRTLLLVLGGEMAYYFFLALVPHKSISLFAFYPMLVWGIYQMARSKRQPSPLVHSIKAKLQLT